MSNLFGKFENNQNNIERLSKIERTEAQDIEYPSLDYSASLEKTTTPSNTSS